MPVTYPDLATHLAAIGNALILAGDPSTAGGLAPLGLKEGDITVEWNPEFSNLTAPEQTGPAVHESKILGHNPVVSFGLIIGDPTLYATLAPDAAAGGGHLKPQPVTTTSLVIVPESEFGDGPWSYTSPTWSPAAPAHAVWFWRGYFMKPNVSFRVTEGGKRVEQVQFQVMFAKASDPGVTLPDGQKLWTIGDPAAQGVTGLAI